ncbi:hypothetical protein NXS98_02620 [Fontisphaera persica]|uniref:hypothetical protein n=1 Tax=Fontisphaera persica TaxID=2974023 RepID=UPI0024BFD1FA|nr:hypothetical protein [Fontisphaera persica]WCJ60039.1 hypothetical protein NXS98_02620 [Fontisphaera persica]
MSAISETIVREYFELHGFFIHQERKAVSPVRREDEDIDFVVWNPQAQPSAAHLPFVLRSRHLRHITRAVVVVRGWHTEAFTAAFLNAVPEMLRFLQPDSLERLERVYPGPEPLLKLLVAPELPVQETARQQSIEFLKSKGLDGVLLFRDVLADLVDSVEANRNYQKSDLLQVIRILKKYGFLRGPQLELFNTRRSRSAGARKSRPDPGAQE